MQGAHLLESIGLVFHQSSQYQMEAIKKNSGKWFACLENVLEVTIDQLWPSRYGPENVEPRVKVVFAILLGYPLREEHTCREREQGCCPARSPRAGRVCLTRELASRAQGQRDYRA